MDDALKMVNVSQCEVCKENPCLNDATCHPSSTQSGFRCNCSEHFIGTLCEEAVERCFPGACHQDGECVDDVINGFTCKCSLGRFGQRCEKGMLYNIRIVLFVICFFCKSVDLILCVRKTCFLSILKWFTLYLLKF